jgi:hypothetical protein
MAGQIDQLLYSIRRYNAFVTDMTTAGYKPFHYNGRFYYKGPAVTVDRNDLQDVIRATEVKLQWDEMGRDDVVVYPR